jgi:hypothetical protein
MGRQRLRLTFAAPHDDDYAGANPLSDDRPEDEDRLEVSTVDPGDDERPRG